MNAETKLHIVDAHMHFYDSRANRYAHMEQVDPMLAALLGDYSALPKRYLFEDYAAEMRGLEIDGIVWHEFIALDPVRELAWAEQLAKSVPVPMAIVTAVDFLAPDLEEWLEACTQHAHVAGVRQHLGWDENRPLRCMAKRGDLLRNAQWRKGVRALKKYNFKCTLEVFSPQLPDLLTVIQENPEVEFIVPVMGWPSAGDDETFDSWKRALRDIAPCDNARITITALECVFGMDWEPRQAHPWVEAAIERFGTERVMFGSHSPISQLARRVASPYAAYEEMTHGLSEQERDAVFRRNAAKWFFGRLDPKKVRVPKFV